MKIHFYLLLIIQILVVPIKNFCSISFSDVTVENSLNVDNIETINTVNLNNNVNIETNYFSIGNNTNITVIYIYGLPVTNTNNFLMIDENNYLYINSSPLIKSFSSTATFDTIYTNFISSLTDGADLLIGQTNGTNIIIGTNNASNILLNGNTLFLNANTILSNNQSINIASNISSQNNITVNTFSIDNNTNNNITGNKFISTNNYFNTISLDSRTSDQISTITLNNTTENTKIGVFNLQAAEEIRLFGKIFMSGLSLGSFETNQNLQLLLLNESNQLVKTNLFSQENTISSIDSLNRDLIININDSCLIYGTGSGNRNWLDIFGQNIFFDKLTIQVSQDPMSFFFRSYNSDNTITFNKNLTFDTFDLFLNTIAAKTTNFANNIVFNGVFETGGYNTFNCNNINSGQKIVADRNNNWLIGIEPGSSKEFKEYIEDFTLSKEDFLAFVEPVYFETEDQENNNTIICTLCPLKIKQHALCALSTIQNKNQEITGYEEQGLIAIILSQLKTITKELQEVDIKSNILEEKKKTLLEKIEQNIEQNNNKTILILENF